MGVLPAVVEATPILLGQTVRATYEFDDLGELYAGPVDVVVGPPVELPNFALFADVDLSDTNILFAANRHAGVNDVNFDGFHFFDVLGTIPAFTSLGVSLNPATNYEGFVASRITFDADNIWVNVANLPGVQGQVISIDLAADVAAVPEPSTLLLLGAGLLAPCPPVPPPPP